MRTTEPHLPRLRESRFMRLTRAAALLFALLLCPAVWANDTPTRIFSDLDETLRSSESPTLSSRQRAELGAVMSKASLTVVTGSQWSLAESKLNKLGVAINEALVGGGEILMRRTSAARWEQDVAYTTRLLESAGGFSGRQVHQLLEPLLRRPEFRHFVLQGADNHDDFALFQSWDASRRDFLAARLWLPAQGRPYQAVERPIARLVAAIDQQLRARGVRAQYTLGAHDRDRDVYAVDIKPGNKGTAVSSLVEHEGIGPQQVVVAGNALNDTEFTGRLVDLKAKGKHDGLDNVSAFVVPGDARPELVAELKKTVAHRKGPQRLIVANGSCPAGTIHGLSYAVGIRRSTAGLRVLHNPRAKGGRR